MDIDSELRALYFTHFLFKVLNYKIWWEARFFIFVKRSQQNT